MEVDIINMYSQLASLGHAPTDGCSLFGVGLDDDLARLKHVFLDEGFRRGSSAEKFVLGPYGSGKSHFLNQFMELARSDDCVTSAIALSKSIDYTDSLLVYKEIVAEIRIGDDPRGLSHLLRTLLNRIKKQHAQNPDAIAEAWVSGLGEADFESLQATRVYQLAFRSILEEAPDRLDRACSWLSGDVTNAGLAKELGASKMNNSEAKLFGTKARITLFQLIHHAGLKGTVVGFDEAEQGLAVNKTKLASIFSQLMQELNALVSARPPAAALVLFALTPDIRDKMVLLLPPLAQRLSNAPGQGFFENNTRAPIIDLTQRTVTAENLRLIGHRLVDVFFTKVPEASALNREAYDSKATALASEVAAANPGASARRDMVKAVATTLLSALDAMPTAGPAPQAEF